MTSSCLGEEWGGGIRETQGLESGLAGTQQPWEVGRGGLAPPREGQGRLWRAWRAGWPSCGRSVRVVTSNKNSTDHNSGSCEGCKAAVPFPRSSYI